MDWAFLVRYTGLYTVLLGGGTITVAYLLPNVVRPYALLVSIAVGLLLFGRAALSGGGGAPTSGGDPVGAGLGVTGNAGNEVFASRQSDPAGAGWVFYAVGLVGFGLIALVTLL